MPNPTVPSKKKNELKELKLTKSDLEFRTCPFCGKPCTKASHYEYFYNPFTHKPLMITTKAQLEWFRRMCAKDN